MQNITPIIKKSKEGSKRKRINIELMIEQK
jgi:hypothetical protein